MSEIPFSTKSDQRFTALIEELQAWPGPQISSHKSANQYFHKLVFLADAGCTLETPGMQSIVDAIMDDVDENGIPCLFMNIPKAFGGSGTDSKAWVLCDAPSTLYALVKLGVQRVQGQQGERINMAVDYLAGLIGVCGWKKELGSDTSLHL